MNTVALRQGSQLAVGTQQGNWVWDGTRWVCCDGDGGFPPPFPPGPPPFFPPPQGQPPWYPGANGGVSFSPTAPPNPIRGAFWWDGQTLWLFDGATWVVTGGTPGTGGGGGGGAATGSNPPSAPYDGQLWFNGSVMYVWDGNAWVPTSATKSYIQATAPPAPNPGDTWWNGTQFFIWTGTTWANVGPGQTVGPTPTTAQVFSVATLSGGSMSASTWNILPINGTPSINVQGQGTWNINTHQWTPNVAGVYAFEVMGWNSYAGYAGIFLAKNDSGAPLAQAATVSLAINEVNNAGWCGANGFGVMNGTTDFVRVWWWSTGGVYDQSYGFPTLRAFLMP